MKFDKYNIYSELCLITIAGTGIAFTWQLRVALFVGREKITLLGQFNTVNGQ